MKKTLFINGMQRSGNHAIISWLIGQFENPVLFLNLVNLKAENPLRNFAPIELPPNSYCHKERINGKQIVNYSEDELVKQDHDYLVCTTENENTNCFPLLDKKICETLGESEKKFNIIVLRDPLNALASYIKRRELSKVDKNLATQNTKNYLKTWLNHAQVVLEKSNNNYIIPIIYNKWLIDKDYRDKICSSLGLINKDQNVNYISDAGRGSSFGGRKIDLSNKSVFFERFDQLNDEEKNLLLLTLSSQNNLSEICQKIFGLDYKIPNNSFKEKDLFANIGQDKNKRNEPADILRNVAIAFELMGDYHTAAKIMKQALIQRPSGPTIKSKLAYYEEKIKS
jgi:hypothetical protein